MFQNGFKAGGLGVNRTPDQQMRVCCSIHLSYEAAPRHLAESIIVATLCLTSKGATLVS